MKDGVKVQDVMEAYIVTSDKTFFLGCLEESGISKTVDSELLTCGIGNKVRTKLFSAQNYSVNVQPLLHSDNVIALQTGTDFTEGATQNVFKHETHQAVDNVGTIEVTLSAGATPLNDAVTILDKYNNEFTGSYDSGTSVVTITDGVAGDTYVIVFQEEEASADILEFDATAYPKNVHLQLHTIGYDPDTNDVIVDIYYDFPIASPDGNMDAVYTKGTNTSTPINFDIINDLLTDSYGTYSTIERA